MGLGTKEEEGKGEETEQQELEGASRIWPFVKWVKRL